MTQTLSHDAAQFDDVAARRLSCLAWAMVFLFAALALNLSLVHKWSLDGDEYYTLRDSSQPLWGILKSKGGRALYYLVCHFGLQLPIAKLDPIVMIRIPAAVFASLLPVTVFALLDRPARRSLALSTALLMLAHPWIFELGQFARYYTMVIFFSSVAVVSLYHWLETRRHRWLVRFVICTLLATFSHSTAVILLPAGVLAVVAADFDWLRPRATRWIQQHPSAFAGLGALLVATLAAMLYRPVVCWLAASPGQTGNYSNGQLIIGLFILSGLQLWALGWIPLLRPWSSWSAEERFLAVLTLSSFVPFLLINPIGSGVAVRYLLPSLPAIVLMAARSMSRWVETIPHVLSRVAVVVAILAGFAPGLLSNLQDGNHHDFRSAVRYVENLPIEHPIIASTTHGIYQYYSISHEDVAELDEITDMNGGHVESGCYAANAIKRLMAQAEAERRPLILVSSEDRRQLDQQTQQWMSERFAVLARFERPRFDYRRNCVVVYEYRPANRLVVRYDS